jgi:hypothetical protein
MKAHKGEESFASVRGQPGPFSLTLTKGRVFRPRTLQFLARRCRRSRLLGLSEVQRGGGSA